MTVSAIISVGCAIGTSAETVTHNFLRQDGNSKQGQGREYPSTAVASSAPDSTPQSLPASGMHMGHGTPSSGLQGPSPQVVS